MPLKGITGLVAPGMGLVALLWGTDHLWKDWLQSPEATCDSPPSIVVESPVKFPVKSMDSMDFSVRFPWMLTPQFSLPYLPQIQRYPLTLDVLEAYADRLTVQVWGADGLLGSGTLLGRSSSGMGWVLTNAHVLRWSKPPFQIHLSDRTVLDAAWVKSYPFDGADVALLQVNPFPDQGAVFPTVAPPPSPSQTSPAVFATGWTIHDYYPHWQFVPGTVIYQLDKPLAGGYQFGYSSLVEKGMSGGPVLDRWGQLVGLNGMIAEPLWEIDHTYEDGTKLDPSTQRLIYGYSWGIPSDRFQGVWQEMNSQSSDRLSCKR